MKYILIAYFSTGFVATVEFNSQIDCLTAIEQWRQTEISSNERQPYSGDKIITAICAPKGQ